MESLANVVRGATKWSIGRLALLRTPLKSSPSGSDTNRDTSHSKFFNPSSIFTSGYALLVVVMFILLNRIQHIVVPPRASIRGRRQRSVHLGHLVLPRTFTSQILYFLNSLRHQIFPLDLDSTLSRLILCAPSLLHACLSLILLTVTILQVLDIFPSSPPSSPPSSHWSIHGLGVWALKYDMYQICWKAFMSACFVILIGAFLAGLEGRPSSAPHFNLFGYACTLHAFGSPQFYEGTSKQAAGVSRPNVHIIFIIMLPLFQITLLHAMNVKKTWGTQRIIPTSICGLLGIAHFVYTLITNPSLHPHPTSVTSAIELALLLIIVITHALDFFTRLLLSPAFDSGTSDTPTYFFLAPSSWSTAVRSIELVNSADDFTVAIVKMAMACLDATNFVGLANEVAHINADGALTHNLRSQRAEDDYDRDEDGPTVRLGSTGVAWNLTSPLSRRRNMPVRTQNPTSAFPHSVGTTHAPLSGFLREIKRVVPHLSPRSGQVAGPSIGGFWMDSMHHSDVSRLGRTIRAVGVGMWIWALRWFRRGAQSVAAESVAVDVAWDRQPRPVSLSQPDYCSEDGDDSDYEDDGQEVDDTGSSDENSDFSRSASRFSRIYDNDDDDDDDDPTNLYADMDSEEAPVLLAHLQRPWLTRNRYGPIVNPSSRITAGRRQEDEESRRNCVICTVEPRVIICWPCRCLALCDDCRGGLAARSASSKHHCPCCRQSVEGYSRIFIP